MNDHEIERIAAAVNQLRPDWPRPSLATLMRRPELAARPRRDIAVALTWVACESATTTPARVIEAGPWWRAVSAEDGHAPRPPKPTEACRRCGRGYRPDCCDDPSAPQPASTREDPGQAAREDRHRQRQARIRAGVERLRTILDETAGDKPERETPL